MQERKKRKSILEAGKAGVLPIVVVALIVIGVLALSGCTEFSKYFQTQETTPSGGIVLKCAEFSITPSVTASNGVLNTGKTEISIPFLANTSSHGVREGDNTTWVNPVLSFVISPTAYPGAKTSDLAILHYEVMNPSQTVDSSSGTYYILTKSSNEWQATWTGDGTHYVSGTTQMAFTANKTLTLTLTIDQTGLSYTQSTYNAQTLTIRFYNDCSWSQTVDVKFVCTHTGTTYRLT